MQAQSGVGTWIANAFIIGFLVLAAALVLRLVVMVSLLLIAPGAAALRKIPLLRRLLPKHLNTE